MKTKNLHVNGKHQLTSAKNNGAMADYEVGNDVININQSCRAANRTALPI